MHGYFAFKSASVAFITARVSSLRQARAIRDLLIAIISDWRQSDLHLYYSKKTRRSSLSNVALNYVSLLLAYSLKFFVHWVAWILRPIHNPAWNKVQNQYLFIAKCVSQACNFHEVSFKVPNAICHTSRLLSIT